MRILPFIALLPVTLYPAAISTQTDGLAPKPQKPDPVKMNPYELDYRQAGAFVDYLIGRDRGRLERLKVFFNAVSKNIGPGHKLLLPAVEQACRSVYGLSLEELEAAWREENSSKR